MSATVRPWDTLLRAIESATGPTGGLGHQEFIDLLWEHLAATGVSWVGIYYADPGAPEESRLVLGARRDSPACSPIGLHGVCGRCWRQGEAIVIEDVADLGEEYIACDPRDRSEVVVPLGSKPPWGVLDLDSHQVGCFGPEDARQLARAVGAARLAPPPGLGEGSEATFPA